MQTGHARATVAHPIEVGQQRRNAGVGHAMAIQALQECTAHVPEHDLRRKQSAFAAVLASNTVFLDPGLICAALAQL